jgi:hypothetical protein
VHVNRWIGHAEALLGWLTVAMLVMPVVAIQVPVGAAILLYGGALLDRAAGWHLHRRLGRAPRRTELQWARRPFIYVATFLSLTVIYLLAWRQWRALVPLTTAIVAGMVLRALAAWRQARLDREPGAVESEEQFRGAIVRWAARLDGVVALLVLGGAIAVPTLLLSRARVSIRADRADRGRLAVCEDRGPAAKPGPVTRDVSLFLVSDSQFHELDGSRTAAQLDLVDSLVPVAVRPVELDLLSEFTLLHFAKLYESMHTGDRAHMLWGHLGDFGDVGCVGELQRMKPIFAAFGAVDRLAGIARGNHDDTFVGNFDWHPDWDAACPSGRLGKIQSSEMIRAASSDVRLPAAIPLGRDHPLGVWLQPERSWRAMVAPLGVTSDGGSPRGVVGVFLDTSDYDVFALGIAGLRGSISSEQVDAVLAGVGPCSSCSCTTPSRSSIARGGATCTGSCRSSSPESSPSSARTRTSPRAGTGPCSPTDAGCPSTSSARPSIRRRRPPCSTSAPTPRASRPCASRRCRPCRARASPARRASTRWRSAMRPSPSSRARAPSSSARPPALPRRTRPRTSTS